MNDENDNKVEDQAQPADGGLNQVATDPEPENNLQAAGASLANTPGGGFNTGAELPVGDQPEGSIPATRVEHDMMEGRRQEAFQGVGKCTQCDADMPHQHTDPSADNYVAPVEKEQDGDQEVRHTAEQMQGPTGDLANAGEVRHTAEEMQGPIGDLANGAAPGNESIEPEADIPAGQPAGESVVANDDGPKDQTREVTTIDDQAGLTQSEAADKANESAATSDETSASPLEGPADLREPQGEQGVGGSEEPAGS